MSLNFECVGVDAFTLQSSLSLAQLERSELHQLLSCACKQLLQGALHMVLCYKTSAASWH